MAYTLHSVPARGALNRSIRGAFSALGAALIAYMERRSRQDEITRLEAMSDAELHAQGLRRDRIVHHVFRDKFYI